MKKIMFLCTANSCRSQMAEGLGKDLLDGLAEVYSAGSFAAGVHPRAIAVMKEIGIDISAQTSKEINHRLLTGMDMVITLCSDADKTCPMTPPTVKRIHWPIKDPVGAVGDEETVMKDFRRARDEIRAKIEALRKDLEK